MLYLIGTGLSENSITAEALKVIKKCETVYLESYTVDFPYTIKNLEKQLKTKIISLSREQVESESFLDEAKKQNIALLVYGDTLSATTHFSIIQTCKTKKIKYQILHNSSILTAIAETGLQLYKFGKTASMPKFQESFKPTSFIDLIKQNQAIKAHTLLLIDIGLEIKQALEQLKQSSQEKKLKLDKIIICSQLGTQNSKIYYNTLNKLSKTIEQPYCIIIPSELNFTEKEFLSKII
jgi:diphthine synthase